MTDEDIDLLGRLTAIEEMQAFLLAKTLRDVSEDKRAIIRATFDHPPTLAVGMMDAQTLAQIGSIVTICIRRRFDHAEQMIAGWDATSEAG